MITAEQAIERPAMTLDDFILGVPGIYPNVPAASYHKLDACSKSGLDWIADYSPMHLQYRRDNPEPPTDALIFGSALHCAILEPDDFEKTYQISGQCEQTKGDGKRCNNAGTVFSGGRWLCGVKGHGMGLDSETSREKVLTQEQGKAIENIARAISFHKAANWLLKQPGQNECSAIWKQPVRRVSEDDFIDCKLRADGVRAEVEMVLDIKTTACASREEFERSIATYGYHRQAAFYQDGLAAHGIKVNHFAFIVVEKTAPYGVAAYRIMDEAIQAGREETSRLLEIYAQCKWASRWPGYSDEFQDISLPSWKMRQLFKESGR